MHHFGNFKGFESAELDLFEPLTVLIGPNGSGKSNAIEGIELLSYIARGGLLHEISDVGRGGNGLEAQTTAGRTLPGLRLCHDQIR
ncbi:MAG: AAA family ATPase [Thermodesulfobacteriota bacterium]|nr:AAA family ATPase [Thermodesulfobacteriota bacterium]